MSVRSFRLKIGIQEINEIQQLCEIHLNKYRNPVQLYKFRCLEVEIRHAHANAITYYLIKAKFHYPS